MYIEELNSHELMIEDDGRGGSLYITIIIFAFAMVFSFLMYTDGGNWMKLWAIVVWLIPAYLIWEMFTSPNTLEIIINNRKKATRVAETYKFLLTEKTQVFHTKELQVELETRWDSYDNTYYLIDLKLRDRSFLFDVNTSEEGLSYIDQIKRFLEKSE